MRGEIPPTAESDRTRYLPPKSDLATAPAPEAAEPDHDCLVEAFRKIIGA
jgi:hypothetical protein